MSSKTSLSYVNRIRQINVVILHIIPITKFKKIVTMKITRLPVKMLKTMLIPGATFCAVPLMVNREVCQGSCNCPKLCKPSELPIYGSTDCCRCAQEDCPPDAKRDSTVEEPNILERSIKNLREGITDIYGKFQQQKGTIDDKINEGTQNVKCFIVYLREEASDTHRLGAIAMGGAAGFILALRGGLFRRIIYTGTGAGIMYYICYPNDAERQATEGLALTKQYVKIAYNFMYGVKPGDEPIPLPTLPKLPTNLNDTFEFVGGLVLKVKEALIPAANEETTVKEEK